MPGFGARGGWAGVMQGFGARALNVGAREAGVLMGFGVGGGGRELFKGVLGDLGCW